MKNINVSHIHCNPFLFNDHLALICFVRIGFSTTNHQFNNPLILIEFIFPLRQRFTETNASRQIWGIVRLTTRARTCLFETTIVIYRILTMVIQNAMLILKSGLHNHPHIVSYPVCPLPSFWQSPKQFDQRFCPAPGQRMERSVVCSSGHATYVS